MKFFGIGSLSKVELNKHYFEMGFEEQHPRAGHKQQSKVEGNEETDARFLKY